MDSTEVWLEIGGLGLTALFMLPCAHSPPFYEYQFNVYLRNIIISKSNKQSFHVGTAHYLPDRCMRDGYRVELQQEMSSISADDREVYLMTISQWLTALLGGLQPYNLHS